MIVSMTIVFPQLLKTIIFLSFIVEVSLLSFSIQLPIPFLQNKFNCHHKPFSAIPCNDIIAYLEYKHFSLKTSRADFEVNKNYLQAFQTRTRLVDILHNFELIIKILS